MIFTRFWTILQFYFKPKKNSTINHHKTESLVNFRTLQIPDIFIITQTNQPYLYTEMNKKIEMYTRKFHHIQNLYKFFDFDFVPRLRKIIIILFFSFKYTLLSWGDDYLFESFFYILEIKKTVICLNISQVSYSFKTSFFLIFGFDDFVHVICAMSV